MPCSSSLWGWHGSLLRSGSGFVQFVSLLCCDVLFFIHATPQETFFHSSDFKDDVSRGANAESKGQIKSCTPGDVVVANKLSL